MINTVLLYLILPIGTFVRPLIDRPLMGHTAGWHVDDGLLVPVDDQPITVGDFADHRGQDLPLATDGQECLDVLRFDDGHHPFLRFAHQDLFWGERRIPERYPIKIDVHSPVPSTGELGSGAGEPGAPEVLDAGDQPGGEDLQRAFDQQLLHEGVTDLHTRPLLALPWACRRAVEAL